MVCWGSSITAADRKRLNRLLRKVSSVMGFPLEPVEVVRGKRTAKLLSVMVDEFHPLEHTLSCGANSVKDWSNVPSKNPTNSYTIHKQYSVYICINWSFFFGHFWLLILYIHYYCVVLKCSWNFYTLCCYKIQISHTVRQIKELIYLELVCSFIHACTCIYTCPQKNTHKSLKNNI